MHDAEHRHQEGADAEEHQEAVGAGEVQRRRRAPRDAALCSICAGSASTAMNGRIEATPAVSKMPTSSMIAREDIEAAPLARRQQVHQHPPDMS